jgi:hypothetical protein
MATIAASGPIKFSDIQAVMGGSGSVSLGAYAQNASTYFARGVSGIPNTNVNVGAFLGKARALRSGLLYRVFTGGYFNDDTTWFDYRTENYSGLVTNFSNINTNTGGIVPNNGAWENYSVEWFGFFYATVTGTYTFYTESDDASYLWVGSSAMTGYTAGNCIVNNGGGHGTQERSGTVSLSAGSVYPIRIQFGEGGGGDQCMVSFTAPGIPRTYDWTGYVFYGLGTNASFPGASARLIRSLTNSNVDGVYFINVNGSGTPTYCLMNSKWDGGGWMMLMKATRGGTFPFASGYWTDTNTTLNTGQTNRSDGDAKFNVMNFGMVKDVMALWPDVGYTGGSISQSEAWAWLVNNYYGGGTRATVITGFSTANSRDSPVGTDPISFNGFSSSIWSYQDPTHRHVFGGGSHLSANQQVRWGFLWNENAPGDFTSCDAIGGLGINFNFGANYQYSAGDVYGCCGSQGLNRTMRVELYGR